MTVRELIEVLEGCDPDAEVRLGEQSSYPFQYTVSGVIDAAEIVDTDDRVDDDEPAQVTDFAGPVDPSTVYILEGEQVGYFPKGAWR